MNFIQNMIANYPDRYTNGWRNYQYSQYQSKNNYGNSIKLEIKLCITLRMHHACFIATAFLLLLQPFVLLKSSVLFIFVSLGYFK